MRKLGLFVGLAIGILHLVSDGEYTIGLAKKLLK